MNCTDCKDCKDCIGRDIELGCVKDCDKYKCDSVIDSRCVYVNCGSDFINLGSGNNSSNTTGQQNSINGLVIPSCISLYEYVNYLTLMQTNPTCVTCGGNSYSITDLWVEKVSSNIIKVVFTGIDSLCLNTGWSVVNYTIKIKDVTTNTNYTITLYPTVNNTYTQNIGSPIIVPGHIYQVQVTTNTQNGTNTASCDSIKLIVKM
jgi:hypothetical protein